MSDAGNHQNDDINIKDDETDDDTDEVMMIMTVMTIMIYMIMRKSI